jgi:hypothetical protein
MPKGIPNNKSGRRYQSYSSLNRKTERLRSQIELYIDMTLTNGGFARQVDYDKLHEVSKQLQSIINLKLTTTDH